MADDHDPLNETVDQLAEGLTISTDPKKVIAKGTTKAFLKTTLAGTINGSVAAAMAVSGVVGPTPVISQEVGRKPDVESTAANQGQSQPTAEPMRTVMVATTSAASSFGPWIVRTVETKKKL